MKKILSFLLSLVLMLAVVPLGVVTANVNPASLCKADAALQSSESIVEYSGSDNQIKMAKALIENATHYTFNTVTGDTAATYDKNYDMTITVFGRKTCYNTRTMLEKVVSTGLDKQDNIKVVFVDCDGLTKDSVQEMAEDYSGSDITFCYDTSLRANNAMWYYAEKADLGQSITLPLMVFTQKNGSIIKITSGLVETDYFYAVANGDLSADAQVTLSISGKANYDYANTVLELLNELRASVGLSALKMDKNLLAAAMQRAAELGVYYSSAHMRPNGESCFTVLNDEYRLSCGENIAMGQVVPAYVMSDWTNSIGHYKNMTTGYYKSVGIGCFETSDGTLCWVQLFSSATPVSVNKSGKVTSEFSVDAQIKNLNLAITCSKNVHLLEKGNTFQLQVVNYNKGFFDSTPQIIDGSLFNYKSTNSSIATVNSSGKCTVKGNGSISITATLKENSKVSKTYKNTIGHKYKTTTTKATLTKNGKTVKTCSVCGKTNTTTIKYAKTFSLSTTNYTYNGKVRTPNVVVKDSAGNKLKNGTDYTVTYPSGRKSAGTYKVTVKMKGNYSGTKTLTFKIKPISVSKCKIKLSTTSYTYNGKVKTPNVTVKNANGTKLKKGTHYTVTYAKGRKNVGTYKVTIKMKGNYSGTKTLTFKINPPKTTVSKLTAGKKSITVAITKKSTQVTGYQIQYSTSKKFTNAKTKTITSYKTTKYTLKSLSTKKTYYVRVRTYKTVNGKKYYSGWSTIKYKKTK